MIPIAFWYMSLRIKENQFHKIKEPFRANFLIDIYDMIFLQDHLTWYKRLSPFLDKESLPKPYKWYNQTKFYNTCTFISHKKTPKQKQKTITIDDSIFCNTCSARMSYHLTLCYLCNMVLLDFSRRQAATLLMVSRVSHTWEKNNSSRSI